MKAELISTRTKVGIIMHAVSAALCALIIFSFIFLPLFTLEIKIAYEDYKDGEYYDVDGLKDSKKEAMLSYIRFAAEIEMEQEKTLKEKERVSRDYSELIDYVNNIDTDAYAVYNGSLFTLPINYIKCLLMESRMEKYREADMLKNKGDGGEAFTALKEEWKNCNFLDLSKNALTVKSMLQDTSIYAPIVPVAVVILILAITLGTTIYKKIYSALGDKAADEKNVKRTPNKDPERSIWETLSARSMFLSLPAVFLFHFIILFSSVFPTTAFSFLDGIVGERAHVGAYFIVILFGLQLIIANVGELIKKNTQKQLYFHLLTFATSVIGIGASAVILFTISRYTPDMNAAHDLLDVFPRGFLLVMMLLSPIMTTAVCGLTSAPQQANADYETLYRMRNKDLPYPGGTGPDTRTSAAYPEQDLTSTAKVFGSFRLFILIWMAALLYAFAFPLYQLYSHSLISMAQMIIGPAVILVVFAVLLICSIVYNMLYKPLNISAEEMVNMYSGIPEAEAHADEPHLATISVPVFAPVDTSSEPVDEDTEPPTE